MRITGPIPSRTALLDGLGSIIDDLHLARVLLVANSYGTLIASTIIRFQNLLGDDDERAQAPLSKIQHFVLVDMAAFCLHLPDLARNFVYRQPKQAYEWVIWYFSSQDAGSSFLPSYPFVR